MGELMVSRRDALPCFTSVPTHDSVCQACEILQLIAPYGDLSLELLCTSATGSCQTCRLLYLALLQIFGPSIFTKEYCVYKDGNNLRLSYKRNDESGIFLYTLSGHTQSSSPLVYIGRDVRPRRTSYAAIIQDWIGTCRDTHTECIPTGIGVALPKRLLDVGHAGSDQIRLETKLPKSGQYLALSHCWGGGVPIKTLRENLHAMEEVIRFLDLPKTFQDAVTVTKDLGQRYLWIDALFIIQNDPEDWEKESGNMAAIYQNAYLVIGADMAANSEAGFLDPLQGGWHKDGKPIAFVESESTTIYARYYDDHSQLCAMFPTIYGYEDSPLSKRAWTLQEQILAPRMVHFGKREIMWECNSGMFCECMQMDSNMKLQTERVAYLASLNSYPPDKYKTWYKVVNQIMTRSITKRDDIFPALSGLAQQFTDHGAGRYLAGLWLKDLPQGLLWWREYEGERCASSDRAPSWSWASIEDNEQVYHYTDGKLDYTQRLDPVYARVLEAEIEFKGNNLFGAVVSGHLTIYAPLMEVTWKRWFTLEPVRQFSKAPKLSPYFDYKHNLDVSVKLHCLFIGEMSLGGSRTRGLILRKLEDSSESTFKRIGLFQCDSGAKEQFSPALTEETVIIV